MMASTPGLFVRRMLARLRRSRLDDEMREEIDLHIALRRQQLEADGVPPDQAEARARRGFGNVTHYREEARQLWGFPSLDSIAQDARYAVRVFARTPVFTAVALLTLAAGIGATAAVFNVVDAVLLRPLDVRAPRQLFELRATLVVPGTIKVLGGVAPETVDAIEQSATFAGVAGYRIVEDVVVESGGGQRRAAVELASRDYFEVTGAVIEAGRGLAPHDAHQSPLPIVVSRAFWQSALGGRATIGERLSLNGVAAEIVGITRGFAGVVAERPSDVIAPMSAAARIDPATAASGVRLLVRIPAGMAAVEAEGRLAAIYKAAAPGSIAPDALRITLHDASRGISDAREPLTRPLVLGFAIAAVLLLVACANTSGMLVTRFAARQGEFGVRVALGAGAGRLARQLAIEAALLASAAAAAALVMASLGGPLLARQMPIGAMLQHFDVRFDGRLIAFTIGIAAIAAFGAAAASVLKLRRTPAGVLLGAHARTLVRGRRRATQILIGAQVACCLLVLAAAGAMTQTLVNLARVDPGFEDDGATAVTVDAAAATLAPAELPAYYSSLLTRVQAMPGVTHASFAQVALMGRASTTGTVDVAGRPADRDEDRLVRLFWIGPGFLEAAGMRLEAGRTIDAQASSSRERVAVVNHEFARFYFGSPHDALGRIVNRDVRIIGIVANAKYNTLRDEPVRAMFLPHTQAPSRATVTFVIRSSNDVDGQAAIAAIRAFDSRLKVTARPLADLVAASSARERFVATLAAIVSVLAVLLSCAAVYAAVTYSLAERRQELALRLALGASRRSVYRLMLRDPLRMTMAGVLVGLPAAYAMLRAAAALLFGIEPFDPVTIGSAGLFMIAIASVSALLPARRAASIDPLAALRAE